MAGNKSPYPLSKIKRIAIELKDYYFFHSPFQIKNQDRRFIGREKKRLQLLSVLKDTNSDSGTYLITGYRGSGKTSFVNMVLTNIEQSLRLQNRKIQFLRIWVFYGLLILLFLRLPSQSLYFLLFFTITFSVFLCILDPLRRKRDSDFAKIVKVSCWKKISNCLRAIFYVSTNQNIDFVVLNLIRSLFITSSMILITFSILHIINPPSYHHLSLWLIHLILGAIIIFIYWLILIIHDLVMDIKRYGRQSNDKKKGKFLDYLRDFLKSFLRFGRRTFQWLMDEFKKLLKPKLVIRLNLNYGNLTERNILQLIASSLYDRYLRWRRTPFQIFLQVLFLVSFWTLIALPYQSLIQDDNSQLAKLKHRSSAIIFNLCISDHKFDDNKMTIPEMVYNHINFMYQKTRNAVGAVIEYFTGLLSFMLRFLHPIFPKFDRTAFTKIVNCLYPEQFDFLLTTIFFLIYFLIRWLCYHQLIFIPGHSRIFYLLRTLEERINAGIMVQSGTEMPGPGKILKIFRQKHLTYPLADERTIELSIINILKEISRIPILLGHPVFIFVFDELDKMTTTEKPPKPDEEEILYMSSFETMRRRQREVEKILSNLKQLLTTAHAKFIFIAGREMYDAGLADFTGRAFLHSSIFNQTFYIDSFLTDSSVTGDENIYGMVESYVCQFLLPYYDSKWSFQWPKLNDYEHFLSEKYELEKTEIQKVIQLLQDFIIFLTYRGNGSPKKITQLFESYIQPLTEKRNSDEWFIIGENRKSRYLVFNFPQQFITGSTARLIGPLAHTIERTVAQSNDKLATSIFMVLDYLFKFHRTAFRRDFLEWMPEMLDIHSDPDLRHTVQEMLELIEGIYLEKVDNGLFDYRFTNRIKGEIDYACRIDERKSAAFNFTLDESLEAEQFIRRQLNDQLQLFEVGKTTNQEKPLAITRLHEIIGDLHAFDGEYDQAITEYYNALTRLGN